MKNVWFIFSIFLLSLSVYPCSDSKECKSKTEVSENKNHESHNQETEQCAPFCSCACCGISSFQFQNPVYNFKKKIVFCEQKEKTPFFLFFYNKKVANSIWQPPKIS